MTAAVSAQTERRGGAGRPVGACLAVRTSPAALLSCRQFHKAILLIRSSLTEAAVELPFVHTVHVAVAIKIQEPQVARVADVLPEGGAEVVAVQPIDVVVAVAVAEQPEECVHAVAAPVAVPVAVEFPA